MSTFVIAGCGDAARSGEPTDRLFAETNSRRL